MPNTMCWVNYALSKRDGKIDRRSYFTKILRAAFMRADPKSAIKLLNLTVFFALLGSACINAASRMLVKLTPGVILP